MTTPLVDPGMAQSSLTEQQMQSMQREAEASRHSLNAGSVSKEKKLRQACEGFEAVFIQKMWEGMRASLPKEGLMHSREEQFWQGMYDQELGKSLAASGGVGLADMMVSQLSRNLQNASEVAAQRNKRVPLEIAPVPLLPKAAPGTENTAAQKADKASGMYEGEAGQPDVPVMEQAGEGSADSAAPQASGQPQAQGQSFAPGQAQPQPQAQTGPGTAAMPPEVFGSLNEFAAQLGVPPVQMATGQATGQASGQAMPQLEQIEPGLQTFRPGQKPPQSIDELAAALVAQAGRETGGIVNVTTTRQVNATTMSGRNRAVVRQRRNAPTVASGSPVTGRNLGTGTPNEDSAANAVPTQGVQAMAPNQAQQGVQSGRQNRTPVSAPYNAVLAAGQAQTAPLQAAPVQTAPVQAAPVQTNPVQARPASQPTLANPAGPAALRTSVEGLGDSGSELASNTAALRGRQSRRLATSNGD